MDVLIKNMELPKSCYSDEFVYCPFQFFDFNTKSHCGLSDGIRCTKTRRPKGCPLVELPPHGRLVDIDRIIEILEKNSDAGIPRTNAEVACLLKELAKYSTIVEANNGSDN